MNNLPNNIIEHIYYYKHNLEFKDVMVQLLQAKINVFYNFDLTSCGLMCYLHNNIKYLPLDVDNLYVTPKQLFNVITYYTQ